MNQGWLTLGLVSLSVLLTSCKESSTFYTNSLMVESFIQPKAESSYDFLWVLDNSGSMKPRRDYLNNNLDVFLDILNSRKAINYQMAVVTTDAFRDNGALVKAVSGIEVVKTEASSNPSSDFKELVNSITDSSTSFWEQGLENSYQAILKNGTKFSRTGVPLVVVYLTDEEDYSCESSCWGSEPENNTTWKEFDIARYLDFFKTYKKSESSEVVMFPIVGISQDKCTVPSLGNRYITVTESLEAFGKAGSICDSDLAESYNNIARIIADRGNVFRLSSPAIPQTVNVYVDKIFQDPEVAQYSFDSVQNAVVFNGKLPSAGSKIDIVYQEIK
ncbi:MAG: hypothetical protein ACKN9V_06370 [Pseudomonadota bacterium]